MAGTKWSEVCNIDDVPNLFGGIPTGSQRFDRILFCEGRDQIDSHAEIICAGTTTAATSTSDPLEPKLPTALHFTRHERHDPRLGRLDCLD